MTRFLLVLFLVIYSNNVEAKERIALIGDSLAVGLEPYFKNKAKEKHYEPVIATKIGSSIYEWNNKLPRAIKSYKPTIVFISLGTNDAVSDYGIVLNDPTIISELEQKIKNIGAIPVWILPPNVPVSKIPFIYQIREDIRERVSYYFDSSLITDGRSPDKIHFMGWGYELWMEEIWFWACRQELV